MSRRRRFRTKNIIKNSNRTILYVIIATFIIASILIGSTLYNSNKSRQGSMETVNNVSNFFLEELAARRVKLISSELESLSNELSLSVGCIDDEDLKSIKSLRRYIGRMKRCYNLNKFALVDENGYIYTDHSTSTSLSMYPFISDGLKEHYMGTSNVYGLKKQLIIANPVRDITFKGAKITACFMELDIQNMFSSITLNSVQTDVYYNIYYKNGESLTKNSIGNRESGRNLMLELKEASFGSDFSKIFCSTIAIALFVYYVFEILQQTKKDSLTGLLNRHAYNADICKNPEEITALISIDMNGLKVINDTQGHAAGDEALVTLALCFRRALKNRQFGYRIGGDEFVILCRKARQDEMMDLIRRIETNVSETKYHCSVGYSYSPDGKKPVDDMLKESDMMMYAMKERFYKERGKASLKVR